MNGKTHKSVLITNSCYAKLSVMAEKRFEIPVSRAKMVQFFIGKEYKKFVVNRTGLREEELPSITKPEPVTPENISFISDDELRKRIINGQLDDPKLETTLFPKGRPSK
jgi:hypothetical protein|tara:strand:+ start:865 stop:1191 length:327 start_codon:yes stop_codon:yes gene_type:complete